MTELYAVEVRTLENTDAVFLIKANNETHAGDFVKNLETVFTVDVVRKADNADIAFFKSMYKDPITITN